MKFMLKLISMICRKDKSYIPKMKGPTKYETIKSSRERNSFLYIGDFKVHESNEIISDMVEEITNYGASHGREVNTNYEKLISEEGERIKKAIITSNDGIIKGEISHNDPWLFSMCDQNGKIKAEIDFNSNDPKLMEEYQGLARVINNSLNEKKDKFML